MSRQNSSLLKGTDTTPSDSSRLGKLGEDLAVNYLEVRGFTIVMRNFKVTLGRNSVGARITGEIDIIAVNEDILYFVEVKTRRSETFNIPQITVNLRKRRQIDRVGSRYKRIFGLRKVATTVLVVSITISEQGAKPVIWMERF